MYLALSSWILVIEQQLEDICRLYYHFIVGLQICLCVTEVFINSSIVKCFSLFIGIQLIGRLLDVSSSLSVIMSVLVFQCIAFINKETIRSIGISKLWYCLFLHSAYVFFVLFAGITTNMLKLNDNKTELMLVTSKRTKHLNSLPTSITIGISQIPFKKLVKNLGFTLDCHLTMNAHESNIARNCYFELRHLASIRRFLTSTATATHVSAFVLSRIDYCNSLLFGSTHNETSNFQRIENYAARVILRLPMSSSITIHLKSLHWLPDKVRSTYKIACLCYHCHISSAPSYVASILHRNPLHTRNTRSSSYTMPLLNRPAHS